MLKRSFRLWIGTMLLLSSTHMAANAAPPELHVEGNKIKTADGHAIRLRGLCIPSLEWSNEGEQIKKSVQIGIDDWKANIIRLPLSQDRWFGMAQWQDDGGAAYRKLVDELVQTCSDRNVYIVFDLHWSNAGQWKAWNRQFRMPDWNSVPFWVAVAEKYENNPAVWFDLYNEPHDVSWEVWKDGGTVTEEQDGKTVTFETPGLQKLLRAIRQTGAKNIAVAGGLDWGYDLSGVLKGFALNDEGGNGVVYGTHIYPWKGTQPENWNPHVGDIAEKYPVFVGEVGCEPDPKQEDPHIWAPKILKYMDARGLHYTAWCFHWGATPKLLLDNNYTPTPYWGAYVKKALENNQPVRAVEKPKRPAGTAFRDDLSTHNSKLWHLNGPWANDGLFRSAWRLENVSFKNGTMILRLDDTKSSGRDYSGAEIGSHAHYGYGRYEVRMKAAKNPGVISSFFTYTGPPHGNPHHEIDIEFTGNNTTLMDIGYFTDGKAYDTGKVKLGFDASKEWHVYGFEWLPQSITWLVDGKSVFTATPKNGPIPSVAGEIMANLWATQNSDDWAGKFEYSKVVEAQYDWIKYTPAAQLKTTPRAVSK